MIKSLRLSGLNLKIVLATLFMSLVFWGNSSVMADTSPFGVGSSDATKKVNKAAVIPEVPSYMDSVENHTNYAQRYFGIEVKSDSKEWKASELELANSTIKTLPEFFRRCTTGLRRIDKGRTDLVAGYVDMNARPVIYMTSAGTSYKVFQGYLVHEMTHCFQMAHRDVLKNWENKFWSSSFFGDSPKTPSVSDYGNSQPMEDMAESMRMYWIDGPGLKRNFPDRYEFIKIYIMNGVEYFETQGS